MTAPVHLIIFTRFPEPGTTKTRLIPALGAAGAADLQRVMTERTVAAARKYICGSADICSIEVRHDGGTSERMRGWLGDGITYHRQGTGDLGERMSRAFSEAFERGAHSVLLTGSDCPELSAELFADAASSVRPGRIVIGPALDGGYYLIGIHRDDRGRALPGLFQGVHWGSSDVLETTRTAAGSLGLTCHLLEQLTDIDRPEDLPVWDRINSVDNKTTQPLITVVIPALNEAPHLGASLESIASGDGLEVIVVDGGSSDDTVEVARAHGAQIISAPRGRASQLAVGVNAATGEYLLLLHADTRLEHGFDNAIRTILADPGIACGAFTFTAESPMKKLRIIERTTHFRATVLRMPYGDQGLFMRSGTLQQAGGIPDLPFMEDFELVRRLGKRGRIVISPLRAWTSARRWHTRGFWTTTLLNQAIIIAYTLGVSPHILRRWYDGRKS